MADVAINVTAKQLEDAAIYRPTDLLLTGKLLQLKGANGEAVGGGITMPDFDKFELWNDITLSEDVQAISVSETDDGRPLKIKELFFYFCGKFNIDASVYLNFDKGKFYQCYIPLKASNDVLNAFWVYSKKVGDGTYFSIYPATQITELVKDDGAVQGLSSANKETKCDFSHNTTAKTAKRFGFTSAATGFRMLAGSRILAWGVMDDD